MKKNKAFDIILTLSKILLVLLLAVSLFYYAYFLIDAYIDSLNNSPSDNTVSIDPFPLAFAFVLIFSLITNGACLLLASLSLLFTYLFCSSANRKRNMKAFLILLVCPVIMELLLLLSGILTGVFL